MCTRGPARLPGTRDSEAIPKEGAWRVVEVGSASDGASPSATSTLGGTGSPTNGLQRIEQLVIPPRGRTSGSRRALRRGSRPPGSTRPAVASTSTTRTSEPPRSRRSTTSWSASASCCRGFGSAPQIALSSGRTGDWVCALAATLVNRGWFRVGSEQYARRSDVRNHDAPKRHVDGARQADQLPVPRQASCPRPDDARRRGARGGDRGACSRSRAAPACSGSTVTGRDANLTVRCSTSISRTISIRLHGEGLPYVGRDADGGRRARRARPAIVRRRRSVGSSPQ